MLKVLLVTSKWIQPSDSNDGGDATVMEIAAALGAEMNHDLTDSACRLDILCFRETGCEIPPQFVNRVFFQDIDFAHYELYSKRNGEKFLIRLEQANISARKIVEMAKDYNIVVLQHCMFALKLHEYDADIYRKVVLLPMFTGTAYIKSGEFVPQEYIEAEKSTLRLVKKFITPSDVERRTLIEDYGIDEKKITVVPRAVRNIKFTRRKCCSENPQILYLASIRSQKSNLDAFKMLKILRDNIGSVRLHCAGSIQDKSIFRECLKYVEKNKLDDAVIFHGTLKSAAVLELFEQCDINISVSNWETFGRGIFEGMAAGLPTVVLKRIESASSVPAFMRPLLAQDLVCMAELICRLVEEPSFFEIESAKGKFVQEHLSFSRTSPLLRKAILTT